MNIQTFTNWCTQVWDEHRCDPAKMWLSDESKAGLESDRESGESHSAGNLMSNWPKSICNPVTGTSIEMLDDLDPTYSGGFLDHFVSAIYLYREEIIREDDPQGRRPGYYIWHT